MGAGGPPHDAPRLRRDHLVSLHGVAMSISGPNARPHHLRRLRRSPRVTSRRWFEHLASTTTTSTTTTFCRPTDETLRHVCAHIDQVQSAIGREMLLENPSTYVLFEESTWSETDFLREVVRRTGCGLLLDINNVFVSATNHGYSAMSYLADFPLEKVGEIHLAGHAEQEDDEGAPLLIDSHDRPVADPVWALYDTVIRQCGPVPTLVEWDNDVPDWPVLKSEADAAQAILDRHAETFMLGRRHAVAG